MAGRQNRTAFMFMPREEFSRETQRGHNFVDNSNTRLHFFRRRDGSKGQELATAPLKILKKPTLLAIGLQADHTVHMTSPETMQQMMAMQQSFLSQLNRQQSTQDSTQTVVELQYLRGCECILL